MRWMVLWCVLLTGLPVAGGEWHVDAEAEDNRIQFTSEVVSFSFSGTTDKVDGYVYWEGDGLLAGATQLHLEVDLASLDTGIGKRDRDMRDVLDTRKHPRAVFHGVVLQHAAVDTSITLYEVTARGTMSLHGVAHELTVSGTIRIDGDRWQVRSTFTIRLSDYEIEAPSLAAFIKVSEEVEVQASFAMKPAAAGEGE